MLKAPTMQLSYETWDVFTDTPFTGNPLAIVFGADALPTEQLRLITAEFGYAETVFLFPPASEDTTARVRIFEPEGELPFAGHPLIGAASLIAGRRVLFSRPVAIDALSLGLDIGPVPVRVEPRAAGQRPMIWLQAPKSPEIKPSPPVAALAALCGLAVDDIATTGANAPAVASVGLPFCCARVVSPKALARARPVLDPTALAALRQSGGFAIYLYHMDGGLVDGRAELTTRMLAPASKVTEDAATGSAAAALTGLLGTRIPGLSSLKVHQGAGLGRPSVIHTRWQPAGAEPAVVHVGGTAVPVMAGSLWLPID